jgi:hypothetical protein
MKPNEVAKMSLFPCAARSRITRSASAPSGTFSTNEVFTLAPNSASTAFRAWSWANVQPASPTGPTYIHATLNGSAARGLGVAAGAAALGGGGSSLPQAASAATAANAAAFNQERLAGLNMWFSLSVSWMNVRPMDGTVSRARPAC